MSYSDVLDGLHERFATVPGIAALLRYEPRSVQATPLLYSVLEQGEDTGEAGTRSVRHRILHRLLVDWQDNEQAELQLVPFYDSLRAAVDADPQLGGRIPNGYAKIVRWERVFVEINGITYIGADFHSEVDEG